MNRTRWLAAAVAALLLLALAVLGGGAVFLALRSDPPVEYTVVRGDTLFVIARDHGVGLDDLRAWNGIEGDRIEVGQILLIHMDRPTELPAPKAGKKSLPPKPLSRADAPATPPELTMPTPKDCLAGPELSGTDQEMAASEGLSHTQVSAAMNAFLPNVLPCITESGLSPERALMLEFRVGCDGRVASVHHSDRGDWTPELAACIVEVLSFTPFPAHGLPDGDSFSFPLQFSPD